VHGDQRRRLVEALRRVKIAEQLHAVVLGKEDVVARHHLIVGLIYKPGSLLKDVGLANHVL
jgi:hypothetical protein